MSRKYHEVYKIIDIKDEAKDVKTFRFETYDIYGPLGGLVTKPGNFVIVWLPGISENPFSVFYNSPLGITVKKVGDFTSRLFELHIGDRVWIRGPYGNSFTDFSNEGKKYLIAAGTGAIPLAFLSENLTEKHVVLLGAGAKDEILFEERFKRADVLISTEDGSYGYKGLVTDLFNHVDIESNSRFYICGPEKMMAAAAEKASTYTDEKNVILSLERYMKCGRGLCGSCEIDGYRTCVDGPVFSYKMLIGGNFGKYSRTKSGMRQEL